jgi:hypothetical protein
MFHRRSTEFDPRISAIAGHLRAIEKELGALGKSGGRRAAATASVVGNQIADAIVPVLSEIVDRFLQGESSALKDAASLGDHAVRSGARLGKDALQRITTDTKRRPLVILAVALGVGVLIGIAARRK